MDKRTGWVSVIVAAVLIVIVGSGGKAYSVYHGQAERLDVLQRELQEKSTLIEGLNNKIEQTNQQVEEHQQQVVELKQQVEDQ